MRAKLDTADHSRRRSEIARIVSEGMMLADAGRALGLSKGETSRAWMAIKAELGAQAC